MRHRDARQLRHGQAGAHTGDDAYIDPPRPEVQCLLPTAAEEERVATFQTHDDLARRGLLEQYLVDIVLLRLVHAAALADIDELRARSDLLQQFLAC